MSFSESMTPLRRRRLAVALAFALAVVSSAPAGASLDWLLLSGWGLEAAIGHQARLGFEVQAVLVDSPEPAVLLARECCGRREPAATYRLVDRASAATVERLGADGHRLVAFGPHRIGGALAVFAHHGRGAGLAYRSLQGDAATLAADVERLAADGHRCVAAAGRTMSSPDWLLFERGAKAVKREARVVVGEHAEALAKALAPLAREGFSLDCAWSRGTGKLTWGGATGLGAVVSRSPGATRPVAHTRIDIGTSPTGSGTLLAVAPYGSRFAFLHREDRTSVDSDAAEWPTDGKGQRSWALRHELHERLRSSFWDPVSFAWVVHDAGQPARIGAVERDEDAARARAAAADAPAARAPTALPIPKGATALADGGDPWRAYQTLMAAIGRKDLKATKRLWTGEVAKAWEGRVKTFKAPFGLGFSEKELFADLHEDLPTDPELVGGWEQGDAARLRVEGTVDGERSVADLDFAREGGVWKLAVESSWKPLSER